MSLTTGPFAGLNIITTKANLIVKILTVFADKIVGGSTPPTRRIRTSFPRPIIRKRRIDTASSQNRLLASLTVKHRRTRLRTLTGRRAPTRPRTPATERAPRFSPTLPPPSQPPRPITTHPAPTPLPPQPTPISPTISTHPIISRPMSRPIVSPARQ